MKILREGSKNVYTPKREKIVGLGGGGGELQTFVYFKTNRTSRAPKILNCYMYRVLHIRR